MELQQTLASNSSKLMMPRELVRCEDLKAVVFKIPV
jgi:hypothetical protein